MDPDLVRQQLDEEADYKLSMNSVQPQRNVIVEQYATVEPLLGHVAASIEVQDEQFYAAALSAHDLNQDKALLRDRPYFLSSILTGVSCALAAFVSWAIVTNLPFEAFAQNWIVAAIGASTLVLSASLVVRPLIRCERISPAQALGVAAMGAIIALIVLAIGAVGITHFELPATASWGHNLVGFTLAAAAFATMTVHVVLGLVIRRNAARASRS